MLCDAVGMGKTVAALSVLLREACYTLGCTGPRRTVIFCPEGLETSVWLVSAGRTAWTTTNDSIIDCLTYTQNEAKTHMSFLTKWMHLIGNTSDWDAFCEGVRRVSDCSV